MRYINFFLLGFFLMFFSCKKSEEQTPQQFKTSDIAGVWIMKSINYSGQSNTNTDDVEIKTDYRAVSSYADYTINFKQDNTYSTGGGYILDFTSYTYPYKNKDGEIISSNSSNTIVKLEDIEIQKRWSLDQEFINGVVFSDTDNQSPVVKIISLDENELRLDYKSTVSEFFEEDNQEVLLTYDIDGEIILERSSLQE